MRRVDALRRTEGFLGPGLVLRGNLEGRGDLTLEAVVEGDARLDGVLVVGEQGLLRGDVEAREVVVLGDLEGQVVVRGGLHVLEGGVVVGDVRAARLAVDDGGAVHGVIVMDVDVSEGVVSSAGGVDAAKGEVP
jgi:cytoskeletal protein CcmA (bactofilin family)